MTIEKKYSEKKIMNSGFTLVELSIVLVIIGILLSIVVKGKSLIETALFQKEISNIINLRREAFIAFNENNFSNILVKNDRYGITLYKPSVLNDVTSLKYSVMKSTIRDVLFVVINVYPTDTLGFISENYPSGSGYTKTGPLTKALFNVKKYDDKGIELSTVDTYYMCKIEYALDDGNPLQGDIRYLIMDPGQSTTLSRDCMKYKGEKTPDFQDIAISIDL